MRSYAYSDGSFQPCQDSLPKTSIRSKYGQPSRDAELYEAAMKEAGFRVSSGSEYRSRIGFLTVYTRNHTSLSARRADDVEFDFLCEVSIGGSYIRIWVPDFPNLFSFFNAIGAARVEEEENAKEKWALRENATRVLGELLTGDLTLRVDTSS